MESIFRSDSRASGTGLVCVESTFGWRVLHVLVSYALHVRAQGFFDRERSEIAAAMFIDYTTAHSIPYSG